MRELVSIGCFARARSMAWSRPANLKSRRETTLQGFAPFRTHLELYDNRAALAKTL
jgi:hypothetical protein